MKVDGGREAVFWLGLLGIMAMMNVAWAGEPTELERLCDFAEAEPEDPEEGIRKYHRIRKDLVHQVYETALVGLDENLLDYDRVTGLLTLSGFRNYRAPGGGPKIALRNACILQFEFGEGQAHDVIAQIGMGTVKIEVGFLVAAHDDFDLNYCGVDEEGREELAVDLLYAQLVEYDQESQGRVIGRYQTPEGHQWALRLSTLIVDAARMARPEVAVSHFQWRPEGEGWQEELDPEVEEGLEESRERFLESMERGLYPCYLRALRRNSSLQGAMVMEVSAGAELRWSIPEMILDTMGDQEIRGCVVERMEELMAGEDFSVREGVDGFKATILMRRR